MPMRGWAPSGVRPAQISVQPRYPSGARQRDRVRGMHRTAPRSSPARRRPARRAAAVVGVALLLGAFAGPVSTASANPYWRVPVSVTAGRASCTVSWIRDYWDGPVAVYKVWVVPQNIAPGASQTYRKITVAPQAPGRTANATVGALTKGAPYVFFLEALYPSNSRSGRLSVQVATSRVCVPF